MRRLERGNVLKVWRMRHQVGILEEVGRLLDLEVIHQQVEETMMIFEFKI